MGVTDNGRGIPVDMHKTEKKAALEVVMTSLHAGGKFDKDSYKVSGGLHGVGVSVVNALSTWCRVRVFRGDKIYGQNYQRGIPDAPVAVLGDNPSGRRGTEVVFSADATIFDDTDYDFDVLSQRMRELAFLNAGVTVSIEDLRPEKPKKNEFIYERRHLRIRLVARRDEGADPPQADLHHRTEGRRGV